MEADLRLRRNDLFNCSTNNRGCLVVYPPGKKARQKVAVGDNSGVVQVIQVGKHHEVQVQFATPRVERPISRLDLYQDQLFVASGASIAAFSKKGKGFFGFESNLTETIASLKIDTPFIFTGGDYVLTTFEQSSELGFYMAPDRINDMLIQHSVASPDKVDAFIACQDRTLRTIRDHKCIAESGCESPLVSLAHGAEASSGARKLIYGTLAGTIGAFTLNAENNLLRKFSAIPNERLASITAIHLADITMDGVLDVVVGRDDGAVEVHSFGEDRDGPPKKIWGAQLGECVNSIGSGLITNTARDELIVASYSGKIVTYSVNEVDAQLQAVVPNVMQGAAHPLPSAEQAAAAEATRRQGVGEEPSQVEITAAKVREVTAEINSLRAQLRLRQQEFSAAARVTSAGTVKAVSSEFSVKDKFIVDPTATSSLQIVTDAALDLVAIQADVALEIIDSENVSVSNNETALPAEARPAEDPNGNRSTKLLCVLRASDDDTRRIEVRFRSVEGQYGTLRAFVVPKSVPRTAQMRTYTIRPLALHQRIGNEEMNMAELPLSTLRINGSFSVKDAHSWVFTCLPEVPEMVSTDAMVLSFKNTFQGTFLQCRYTRGEAEFLSDNVSTLAVLKECVSKEATHRKIAVKIASEPRIESVLHTLQLLHPMFDYQFNLVSKLKLIEALKEIEGQEQDTSFLSEDYKSVLTNAKAIEAEMKLQPRRMQYLRAMVEKLLVDLGMFRGELTPQSRLDRLRLLMDRYEPNQLLDFFTV